MSLVYNEFISQSKSDAGKNVTKANTDACSHVNKNFVNKRVRNKNSRKNNESAGTDLVVGNTFEKNTPDDGGAKKKENGNKIVPERSKLLHVKNLVKYDASKSLLRKQPTLSIITSKGGIINTDRKVSNSKAITKSAGNSQ